MSRRREVGDDDSVTEHTMFESVLSYQFAVFLAPQPGTDPTKSALELATVFAEAPETQLRLAFRPPTIGQGVAFTPLGPESIANITWQGTTGAWNMTWTTARVDLYCDALTHAAIEKAPLTISDAGRGLAEVLGSVPAKLGGAAIRAAVVITAEDHRKDFNSVDVAARMCAPHLVGKTGSVPELLVRVNLATVWTLSRSPKQITINRLVTTAANRGQTAPPPSRNRIAWQFDCNTDAEAADPLQASTLSDFFVKASAEAEKQFQEAKKAFEPEGA